MNSTQTTVTDNTETNIAALRAAWSYWLGKTHSMSFDQYVDNAFRGAQSGLDRCGIKKWNNMAEWLAEAKGVI
jgi:hypothetical protein